MKAIILSPIINIVFWGIALAWVLKLEKGSCTCSKDWRRDYMKYYFMMAIALQLLILNKNIEIIKLIALPVALATVVYIGTSISYINDQRKKKCECSKSNERLVLFIFSIFQAAFITWAMFHG